MTMFSQAVRDQRADSQAQLAQMMGLFQQLQGGPSNRQPQSRTSGVPKFDGAQADPNDPGAVAPVDEYVLKVRLHLRTVFGDRSRQLADMVSYLAEGLSGDAATWLAVWRPDPEVPVTVNEYLEAIKGRFENPAEQRQASDALFTTKQAGEPVQVYLQRMRRLYRLARFAERGFLDLVRRGLDSRLAQVVDNRLARDDDDFESFARVAAEEYAKLQSHGGYATVSRTGSAAAAAAAHMAPTTTAQPAAAAAAPTPMDVDALFANVTAADVRGMTPERRQALHEWRRQRGLCFVCGKAGHLGRDHRKPSVAAIETPAATTPAALPSGNAPA
ncbi:hypothetical protein HK105_209514 [Polyrhizophydium stewartii]|uniref:Retrotransposon gag domain-containing protein n=1 Tax=Polyrhizophydium stewartii TaxID=2732419 RepID=A0ABR4MUW5_9FUNG